MKRHIADLTMMNSMLLKSDPFTFVRFSDGEMEILRGSALKIDERGVSWSKGQTTFKYPAYDHKRFDPIVDLELTKDLRKSAYFIHPKYYKGVPRKHNRALRDTEMLLRMNGSTDKNLTYADLFVNSNYKRFLSSTFSILRQIDDVAVIGNWRMKPRDCNPLWKHLKVPDSAFDSYQDVIEDTLLKVGSLNDSTVILSSASSLTNVLGHKLLTLGSNRTFIDIGTALHPFMGLGDALREYQSQLLPWKTSTLRRKIGYHVVSRPKFQW
jgi:hypothetical protein